MTDFHLYDFRCRGGRNCSRLLFRGYLPPNSRIEIRCPCCGKMNYYPAEPVNAKEETQQITKAACVPV